ncbi:MAG: hypothetical protein P1V97_17235 [Planctomycetota bacterium]|nr:hypothetical protein [Planctomycetota bacterium]
MTRSPLFGALGDSKRILLAGAGGGFDLYSALPLFFALKDLGRSVFLANSSFSVRKAIDDCRQSVTKRPAKDIPL